MDDYELEHIYNAAIDGEGKTAFDGLRAVAEAEREACAKVADAFKVNGLRTVVDAIADGIRERSNVQGNRLAEGESSGTK